MLPSLRPFGERSVYLSPYSAFDTDASIRIICDLHSDTNEVLSVTVVADWPSGYSTLVETSPPRWF